jgi:putative transposase
LEAILEARPPEGRKILLIIIFNKNMSIRKKSFVEGEYYHIYNRGNDKKVIFHDQDDYRYFMGLLFVCNSSIPVEITRYGLSKSGDVFDLKLKNKLVSVGVYVLMPNHFHILITQEVDNGISKFMQKLSTGYVMYYNQKYKRTGGLFEGKFKSQHSDTDKYLKYIFSYIHLNPIKLIDKKWKEEGIKNRTKALEFLQKYRYSSFLDYISDISRPESVILNIKKFPNYFPTKQIFWKEILGWLDFGKDL